MKNKGLFLLAIFSILVLSLSFASSAVISQCTTISSSGSYVQNQTFTANDNNCIWDLNANDVDIDGNGFQVNGDPAFVRGFIGTGDNTNVTVHNLIFNRFDQVGSTGVIDLEPSSIATYNIHDIIIYNSSGHAFAVNSVNNYNVTNMQMLNVTDGFNFFGGSINVTIKNTVIESVNFPFIFSADMTGARIINTRIKNTSASWLIFNSGTVDVNATNLTFYSDDGSINGDYNMYETTSNDVSNTDVYIQNNAIFIDSTAWSFLNTSTTLTFLNVSGTGDVMALANGANCTYCSVSSLGSNNYQIIAPIIEPVIYSINLTSMAEPEPEPEPTSSSGCSNVNDEFGACGILEATGAGVGALVSGTFNGGWLITLAVVIALLIVVYSLKSYLGKFLTSFTVKG